MEPSSLPKFQNLVSVSSGQVTLSTIEEYCDDIRRMLGHCRDQGIAIPDSLGHDVGGILLEKRDSKDTAAITRVLRVHGQLSGIIAPATPRSLAATEFSLRAWLTYFLVALFIIAAVGGLIGYVRTLPSPAVVEGQLTAGDVASTRSTSDRRLLASMTLQPAVTNLPVPARASITSGDSLRLQLNYLFAAMIGAAFNGLLTAYTYLRDRSFDPHYVTVYVIRFVVGLLAGVVLANLGSELFQGNDTLAKLGPGIIAVLGGYSAEAVRQILDRLVEVLVTIVKGKDTATGERLTIAKDVLSIAQAAATNPNTPADVREKLDGLLKKLQQ